MWGSTVASQLEGTESNPLVYEVLFCVDSCLRGFLSSALTVYSMVYKSSCSLYSVRQLLFK